jgi:hypothetical protein
MGAGVGISSSVPSVPAQASQYGAPASGTVDARGLTLGTSTSNDRVVRELHGLFPTVDEDVITYLLDYFGKHAVLSYVMSCCRFTWAVSCWYAW